jgi:4-alpha-glucanotransferase
LKAGSRRASSRRRLAGVAVPLFFLRSRRSDPGIGEFFDLVRLFEWAVAAGQGLVSLLPLSPPAPERTSPYDGLSSFALDPLFVTLREVPELAGLAIDPPASSKGRRVDRKAVAAWKAPWLAEAFDRFQRLPEGCERRRAFRGFCAANAGWLEDYALFRALSEERGEPSWSAWPRALRQREPEVLERAARRLAGRIDFERYVQFVAHEQWRRVRECAWQRGILVMGDLPFAPSADSVEVWCEPELFDLGRSIGAPPDDFSAEGQRWGLPAYRFDRLRREDWRWLRRRFRRMRELYDLFRLDHVVGFFRSFVFGEGQREGRFDLRDEAAQRTRGREILEVALAEAGPEGIVAEDLGAVPPFVRECLAELGIPGYKVLRWERQGRRFCDPRGYPECSVATTGTHDTDGLVPWWRSLDEAERAALLELLPEAPPAPPEEIDPHVRFGLLGRLYEAGSRYAIVPLQDLFGWEERINRPGTVGPENWTARMPVSVEELLEAPPLREVAQRLAASIDAAGRLRRIGG